MAKTAVPVEREGRVLFVGPDDPESGTVQITEWNLKDGTVYDVADVPNGGLRVSRDGRRLIAFSTGGGYYGDDPGERNLTLLVYAREAVGLPFSSPDKYVHKLKPKYLSGIVYDDVSGKFYLNYTAGHH